jgi:hypothetical protein
MLNVQGRNFLSVASGAASLGVRRKQLFQDSVGFVLRRGYDGVSVPSVGIMDPGHAQFSRLVFTKRKKLDGSENPWISGCTIVAQMLPNSGSLHKNGACHPNVTC